MAIVGALLLVVVLLVRPQEFNPTLARLSLINVSTGLAVLGTVIDVATGKIRTLRSPQLPWLWAFAGWTAFSTLVKVGFSAVLDLKTGLGFSIIFMFVVMYAARTAPRFKALAAMLTLVAVALAGLCVHQGMGHFECILLELNEQGEVDHDQSQGEPDGRDCEAEGRIWCEHSEGAIDGREYVCEKPGFGRTFTVGSGRVRWRGTLADPNELSLALGAALTFMFAFHANMKSKLRHVLLLGVVAIIGWCVVLTGSRGGVLVLGVTFATYFMRRYGPRGLVVAGAMALPVLLLGGRKGEDAEASSLERLGALYEGLDFFKSNPILGLGGNQFVENYFITAHNSYVLAAAELGLPGMILWATLLYASIKIPVTVALHPPPGMDPSLQPFGLALATTFAGMLVGIFFLSFVYQNLIFIYLGMAGALYGVVKAQAPWFEVKVSQKELGYVALGCTCLIAFLFVYTRVKGNP